MKILVVQTAFPGDAILTLPLIQELKKKNKNFLIDVLCIPPTKVIFEASPYVKSVITIDKKGEQKSPRKFFKFIKNLSKNNYDMVYSPHRSFRSAVLTLGLRVKDTYGFDNSSLLHAYKYSVHYNAADHEVKRNLSFSSGDYSEEKWKILPEIKVTETAKQKVSDFLSSNQIKNFITIAPGSVWNTKKWLAEYFQEVITHFTSKRYDVVLVGGQEDKILCDKILENHQSKVYNASGTFTLVESVELLRRSKLLICNDSAPTHLGMCADIPVITIYCSTVPAFGFYPYNNKSSYLSYDDLKCKPCGIHGYDVCPLSHFNCGKLLKPQLVIQEAERLLPNEK